MPSEPAADGSTDRAALTVAGPAIRFGAAYYPEYQTGTAHRGHDVKRDFDLMVDAGFTVIRVGESVWSTWEPEEGSFDLDWLQETLDEAHARGIGVILGTPTYALPMWLARRHPEIVADSATGVHGQWGARQEMDFTHGAYRFYAERIIRRVVKRYADHPAIIGWQVDNEPGIRLLYNESVFQQFADRLRAQYGTVERLNEAWGLVYWSHRLSTWADLWRPDGNLQPQYDLAWRRFQADLVTEFIGWQTDIVRSIVYPAQFVTTCLSIDQQGVADVDIAAHFDVSSGNAYYEMQDSLAHPSTAPRSTGSTAWIVRGPWAISQLADLMYSSKQAPFLVTETNAGSIGFSSINQTPYDGQWRQAAWLLVARGARMVEYWHWNTLQFGAETFWGGVLPHSGEPGRAYEQIARLGGELGRAGEAFATATPDFDIAVLYDTDSKFALSTQAPFMAPGEFIDSDGYRRIVAAFSRGIFDADRQERLVRPQQLLPGRGGALDPSDAVAAFPVLLVPAFYTASDEDLDFLLAYAEAGGHLVIGPKTAYGDREGRARAERKPARLSAAAGIWYEEFSNPTEPIPIDFVETESGESLALDSEAAGQDSPVITSYASEFIEGYLVDGAEVLASYRHPHYGRWATVTTNVVSAGRITMVGTVPDQELARSLALWLAPEPVSGFTDLPASATVATSTDANGARPTVLHNWGWTETSVRAPDDLVDLLSDEHFAPGAHIPLGAWDVRILRSGRSPSPAPSDLLSATAGGPTAAPSAAPTPEENLR